MYNLMRYSGFMRWILTVWVKPQKNVHWWSSPFWWSWMNRFPCQSLDLQEAAAQRERWGDHLIWPRSVFMDNVSFRTEWTAINHRYEAIRSKGGLHVVFLSCARSEHQQLLVSAPWSSRIEECLLNRPFTKWLRNSDPFEQQYPLL